MNMIIDNKLCNVSFKDFFRYWVVSQLLWSAIIFAIAFVIGLLVGG